jgi:hypothetical protein
MYWSRKKDRAEKQLHQLEQSATIAIATDQLQQFMNDHAVRQAHNDKGKKEVVEINDGSQPSTSQVTINGATTSANPKTEVKSQQQRPRTFSVPGNTKQAAALAGSLKPLLNSKQKEEQAAITAPQPAPAAPTVVQPANTEGATTSAMTK